MAGLNNSEVYIYTVCIYIYILYYICPVHIYIYIYCIYIIYNIIISIGNPNTPFFRQDEHLETSTSEGVVQSLPGYLAGW